jgi:protease-4
MLNTYHERFVSIIAEGRRQSPEEIAPLANGELYTADEALKLHLADAIGYHDDAVKYAQELVGGKPQIFTYEETFGLSQIFSLLDGANRFLRFW